MEQLIKITQHQDNQAVSARDLHEFLESKREFATWIKDRIEKYGLVKNEDYVTIDEIVKRENARRQGASKRTEYVLTLDTAKELAMVEGNDKGKQARRYFIAAEKSYKELKGQMQALPSNASDLWSIAMDVAKIADASIRVGIMHKLASLQGASTSTLQAPVMDTVKSTNPNHAAYYADACKALIQQAVNFEYKAYLPTFGNEDLAIGAAIVDGALRYIKLNNIPFSKRVFFRALGNEIDVQNIKHMPRTDQPLRNKVRDYDNGIHLTHLVKYRNAPKY